MQKAYDEAFGPLINVDKFWCNKCINCYGLALSFKKKKFKQNENRKT